MLNPLDKFKDFCQNLVIDSKEQGLVALRMMGSQRYMIDEIGKGLEEGVRHFVILKGRQMGISTVSLALDLYWMFRNPGIQGSIVTDSDTNRDFFKSVVSDYLENLPKAYKIREKIHNRNQLVLANRSRLSYLVAGIRAGGTLGRGKALNFLHATECSSWADEEGLASLMSTLAEKNPQRLFVFESTARGYNMYYDMWQTAKAARTQRAIFVGWWRNEYYAVPKTSQIYKVYWDGKMTGEEREWVGDIKRLYGVDIQPEQIAWWRWRLAEVITDPVMMFQEFPPTEEYAFVVSGSQFFTSERLSAAIKPAILRTYDCYRYVLGHRFDSTELLQTSNENADLKVWEHPVADGVYVIGADPAYGSSEWADRFAINVLRCYADRLEQVAEYCTSDINTYQFAWVIAHLAGAYKNVMVNLEITGPGQAVWNEIQNMQRMGIRPDLAPGAFDDILANISFYLYHRPDSLGGGYNYHWKTTADTKERMMSHLKDEFERGVLKLNSVPAIEEMRTIVRDGSDIKASGRAKDDRVISLGLAVMAFKEWVEWQLKARGMTYQLAVDLNKAGRTLDDTILDTTVRSFLRGIGTIQ